MLDNKSVQNNWGEEATIRGVKVPKHLTSFGKGIACSSMINQPILPIPGLEEPQWQAIQHEQEGHQANERQVNWVFS
uniref:Uncharacterized protein n=1 Tax=Physcomitrium patens TaxID=3218 RepID=A0A2K1IES8_PHYPA|nr:hypothetical protein PHYPA_029925 [Physcomitrium patens]